MANPSLFPPLERQVTRNRVSGAPSDLRGSRGFDPVALIGDGAYRHRSLGAACEPDPT